jgi:glycosyltransferase involved in cell wall biosynthesis
MSTYNGDKFLLEQLQSLNDQSYDDIHLLVRDDGSTDGTCSILSEPSANMGLVMSVIYGHNIGVISSFFELLSHADDDAKYYSFCDQDDVWKPDKLTRAITQLDRIPSHIPVMYCSSTELVDESLHHLGYWPSKPRKGSSFSNAIIENIAVGCTIVINRAAKELILRKIPDPNRIIMHDWWIYLCISAFGQVVYDSEPNILYRQHGSNIIGGTTSFLQKWSKKLMSFNRNRKRQLLRKQAQEFYRLHGENLTEDRRAIIESFIHSNSSFSKRLSYSWNTKLYRHSALENYLFRLMYLLNMI